MEDFAMSSENLKSYSSHCWKIIFEKFFQKQDKEFFQE